VNEIHQSTQDNGYVQIASHLWESGNTQAGHLGPISTSFETAVASPDLLQGGAN